VCCFCTCRQITHCHEFNSGFRVRISGTPAVFSRSSLLGLSSVPSVEKSLKGHQFFCNEDVIETVEDWFAEEDEFFFKELEALQAGCTKGWWHQHELNLTTN
jgi:hypothetical protein